MSVTLTELLNEATGVISGYTVIVSASAVIGLGALLLRRLVNAAR